MLVDRGIESQRLGYRKDFARASVTARVDDYYRALDRFIDTVQHPEMAPNLDMAAAFEIILVDVASVCGLVARFEVSSCLDNQVLDLVLMDAPKREDEAKVRREVIVRFARGVRKQLEVLLPYLQDFEFMEEV